MLLKYKTLWFHMNFTSHRKQINQIKRHTTPCWHAWPFTNSWFISPFFSSINSMGWDESRDQTRPFNDFTSLGSICPTEGGWPVCLVMVWYMLVLELWKGRKVTVDSGKTETLHKHLNFAPLPRINVGFMVVIIKSIWFAASPIVGVQLIYWVIFILCLFSF